MQGLPSILPSLGVCPWEDDKVKRRETGSISALSSMGIVPTRSGTKASRRAR